MISEKFKINHKFILRSCSNCDRLDDCSINKGITHPTILHSNCAKYGCRAYRGEYETEKPLSLVEQNNALRNAKANNN